MTAVREGVSGGSTNTRRAGRLVLPRSIGETSAAARVSPASSPVHLNEDSDRREQEIKKMTAVWEGVSGGSTNTRRAGRLVPPRSIGETSAAARVSPASSPVHSNEDSDRGEQEIKKMTAVREGVSGGSTNTRRAGLLVPPRSIGETSAAARVSPASSPVHSKVSLSRTASFDGKTEPDVEASADRSPGSLTHHLPVSPFPCIRDKYREPHGDEDAPSSVASSVSSRLPRVLHGGEGALVCSASSRVSKASSPAYSKVSSSRAATCDATYPKLEPDVEGSAGRNTNTKMLHKTRQPSQLQRGGADSDWRDPQVSGKKNEVSDHRYWQTDTVSSRISSASDLKLELVDALEGGNRSTQFKKPLAMSPREPVRFHLPRRLSVLDRRGALDATSESRLLQTHIGHPKHVSTWEGTTYLTTKGPGAGYGYPHPPPFYKCELCCEKTAFYRLKCCHTVVCESCGCVCDSAEAVKGKRLQYRREKLPKVKLEGSDLFLWQPCSFPYGQMLWMARRAENHLQYYFAPIHQLMDPKVDPVEVCVYDFCQQGHDVISLSKTEHLFARNLLH